MGIFWRNFWGIVWESFGNSLRILWEFNQIAFGILNCTLTQNCEWDIKWCKFWVKERQDRTRTTNQILRSTLARSHLKRQNSLWTEVNHSGHSDVLLCHSCLIAFFRKTSSCYFQIVVHVYHERNMEHTHINSWMANRFLRIWQAKLQTFFSSYYVLLILFIVNNIRTYQWYLYSFIKIF